jgi:2-polyprenyl-3-methyl-5-hydroxy-6-metoxy-1,4-benzoquinol methylase
MDQPGLDEDRHQQALKGLARINWISRTAAIVWPSIRRLASERNGQPLRVLDVACGGGDVAIAVAQKAARAPWPIEVAGCDISQTAIGHASARARQRDAKVEFFQADAIGNSLPAGYDIVTCSLFLHHLDEDDARSLLAGMAAAAGRMVLLNDLIRSRLGYFLAYFGTRLLSRSKIVHTDGPLSVRAAFTMDEAAALADAAGLRGAVLTRHWPERFLLTWKRPS